MRPESVTRDMERVVKERRDAMLKYAKAKGVLPVEQAEDCVSLATVRFFNHFDHEVGVLPVTYLYTVMNNVIRDWKRDRHPLTKSGRNPKSRPVLVTGISLKVIENRGGFAADAYAELESVESAKDKLHLLLRQLTSKEKKVLRCMIQGLTNREIGQLLGVCESRAHQHRTQVRKKALECGVCS